jgi:hypothetical protein
VNFDRIPYEMQAWPQWVVWKYEESDGGKPTKVPYSPLFRGHASVTNPGTWGTFEQAVTAYNTANGELAGIGFVLTRHDPFGFIDLDDAWQKMGDGSFKYPDPAAIFERQQKVYSEFGTFAEWSPSGTGLHLIVKTPPVPNGRKRSAIEVYTQERFMTMTGNVYGDERPIEDRGELYHMLWSQMGGPAAIYSNVGNAPETADDNTIIMRALDAVNGEKFRTLLEGRWQELYGSQSEADFAFVDIIAFYTQNREQIERIFLASPLGARDKAKRRNYREYMVNKAFDRQLPPVDVEGLAFLKAQFEAMLANPDSGAASEEGSTPAAPAHEPGKALAATPPIADGYDPVKLFPPGLVGEIAEFIYAAAPRPVREVALVGALGLTAGIIGRAYNVSGTGLNQYALLIAPTGTGKEGINAGISKIMKAVVGTIENGVASARMFIGPAEIRSDAALLKWLAKSPCFLSVTGEFGLRLKSMAQPNASSSELGLKRVLLDLYGKSGHGNVLNPMAYSDKEKNTDPLSAPSFSMVGESTPERFYEVLDEHMISEGLLPRFTIVEYRGKRPPLNKAHVQAVPGFALVDKLKIIVNHCLEIMQKGGVQNVHMTEDAEQLFDQFNAFCDAQINDQQARETNRHLWNRAHLKAMKLAALVAVGVDPYAPVIDFMTAEWATSLVVKDAENILARFEAGEIGAGALGASEAQQIKDMKKIIGLWISGDPNGLKYGVSETMARDGIIPLAALQRRLMAMASFRTDRMGATNAIKRASQHLLDADELRELPKAQAHSQYGASARMFIVANIAAFR